MAAAAGISSWSGFGVSLEAHSGSPVTSYCTGALPQGKSMVGRKKAVRLPS